MSRDDDGLSSSTNIAAHQLETQREKLKLDRAALELAGKQAATQRTAAIASIAHFIYSIVTSSGRP